MKNKAWKHREWHIRNELFGYETEFEITYLALYISLVYIFLSNTGISLLTVAVSIASFWGLLILIILATVYVEEIMKWRVGCKGDECDHPKIYLKD